MWALSGLTSVCQGDHSNERYAESSLLGRGEDRAIAEALNPPVVPAAWETACWPAAGRCLKPPVAAPVAPKTPPAGFAPKPVEAAVDPKPPAALAPKAAAPAEPKPVLAAPPKPPTAAVGLALDLQSNKDAKWESRREQVWVRIFRCKKVKKINQSEYKSDQSDSNSPSEMKMFHLKNVPPKPPAAVEPNPPAILARKPPPAAAPAAPKPPPAGLAPAGGRCPAACRS